MDVSVGDLTPMLFRGLDRDERGAAVACFLSPYGDRFELTREEVELRIRLLSTYDRPVHEERRALAELERGIGTTRHDLM